MSSNLEFDNVNSANTDKLSTKIQKYKINKIFNNSCPCIAKRSFTLTETFSATCNNKRKIAFTLAELLITLGIIGVVAAMTLPTLIQNYKKHEVETKLAKFYTTINQSIRMSETVNGDKIYWDDLPNGFESDANGEIDMTKSKTLAWYNKYLAPYLKTVKVETNSDGAVLAYFSDGSLSLMWGNYILFFPKSSDYPKDFSRSGGNENSYLTKLGNTKLFQFTFHPSYTTYNRYGKGVEPYNVNWDGSDVEALKTSLWNGCYSTYIKSYCAKLIQLNGWKIPKDYPYKF